MNPYAGAAAAAVAYGVILVTVWALLYAHGRRE